MINDKNGYLAHKISYDRNGDVDKNQKFTYNKEGKKTSLRYSFHFRERYQTYEYDSRGNLIKDKRINWEVINQIPMVEIFYTYNNSNKLIDRLEKEQGNFKSRTHNVYDESNKKIETIIWNSIENKWRFWSSKKIIRRRLYTYKNSLKTKEIIISYNKNKLGNKIRTNVYEYVFY